MDFLPVLAEYKAELFINQNESNVEQFSWALFYQVLSFNLSVACLILAVSVALMLTGNSMIFTKKHIYLADRKWSLTDFIEDLVGNFWKAIVANFGGCHKFIGCTRDSFRITAFSCLMTGLIVWIAIRARFTAVLTSSNLSDPFNDLQGLLNSNYR